MDTLPKASGAREIRPEARNDHKTEETMKALLIAAMCFAAPVYAEAPIVVVYPSNMTLVENDQVHVTVVIRCNQQPVGTVRVQLSCPSPLDEVAVLIQTPGQNFYSTSASVTFTPEDYSEKTITLAGYPDSINDGLQQWTVVAAISPAFGTPCIDPVLCSFGPWYGHGQTCDDDGGDDGICEIE